MTDTHALRSSFNNVARGYDEIRPGYPEQLFRDIDAVTVSSGRREALEIGCGTGQATLPVARLGYDILCLDIGANMIQVAAEKLKAYPNVRFQNLSFEEWPLVPNSYDLVFSATAFHWVPREIGFPKAAQALKPGGALAVFSNAHPQPFNGFFEEVQPIYSRVVPEWGDPRDQLPTDEKNQLECKAIEATGLFSSVELKTYPWSMQYRTAEYLSLLNTYSGHLQLEAQRRQRLYDEIGALIDSSYGGMIERPYLTVLYLCRK
jgi:SAM-dependent methyltransferase